MAAFAPADALSSAGRVKGLYAIIDASSLEARGVGLFPFAEAVLDAKPAALQLRAKGWSARRTLDVLRELCPIAHRHGVMVFANDRPDLARIAGCDGVHLGQEDVPAEVARAVGVSRVGVSTHNEGELDAALADDALAYVAIGPVFGTRSKARPDPTLGLSGLSALVERARGRRPSLPIVAIGGIDLATIASVAAYVDAVAVIAALLPGEGEAESDLEAVRARARALVSAMGVR